MKQQSKHPPTERDFTVAGNPDLFVVGEMIFARAKAVSQRAAEQVRDLTGETKTLTFDDDATDEHVPLPE